MTPQAATILLPAELAEEIARLVESGAYPDAGAVVAAGLEALGPSEAEIETWLREEVLPVVDEMDRDPSRAIPAAQVFAELRARYQRRVGEA